MDNSKSAVIFAVILIATFSLIGTAHAASVSSCTTISSAGTYVLTQDITNSGATNCITIEASNVVFDGAGYTIDGVDTQFTRGVYIYPSAGVLTGVTVKNLKLTDWFYGIESHQTTDSFYDNNTMTSNANGIGLWDNNRSVISNNTAVFNIGGSGIHGGWFESAIFINNNVSSNSYGITLSSGSCWGSKGGNHSIINNIANSNTNDGIGIQCGSSNVGTNIKVINNSVSSNGRYGIYLWWADNCSIYDNYLNNTINRQSVSSTNNVWNTTKTLGTNIAGGPYLSGNFWALPDGTGFSETCDDVDGDGICDTSYSLDYVPLAQVVGQPPPTITVTSPTNGTTYTTNIDLNVSADESTDTWWYEYNGNGTSITFTPNETFFAEGGDGLKNITVWTNDNSGNENFSVVYFTVDTTAPNVTITAPVPFVNLTSSSNLLNVTIIDNIDTNAGTVQFIFENGTLRYNASGAEDVWTPIPKGADISWQDDANAGHYNITFSVELGLADGDYAIWVSASDSANNTNSSEFVNITVDNTAPTITVISPQNTTYKSSNVSLKVSAGETINTWWYSLDGGANVTFVSNTTLSGLSDGQHNIAVYANDSAGNVGLNKLALGVAPAQEWNRTFGGSGNDFAESVQQTSDGGYVLAGYTKSFGAGSYDVWLVKTDASGTEQWNRTFGGSSGDYSYSVQQTSDGGYVLVGWTESFGAGGSDSWLVKTDSSGNQQWNRTFGGSGDDFAYSVQQTSDGGYVLAGRTGSFGAGGDFWIVKTDASGTEQWNRTFGGSGIDSVRTVRETSDGGYVLAGATNSFGAGNVDFWLVKTDANGAEQWNRTFGGGGDDEEPSVQQTSDGGYVLAGHTGSFGAGGSDSWLVKTDSSGNQQWNRTFGSSGNDYTRSVQQTSDGGYVLAGHTYSFGAGSYDVWLVKTDANGAEQWNRTFGGSSGDYSYSVQQTSDGGYVLAGDTNSFGAGNVDFWLVKVEPDTSPIYYTVDTTAPNISAPSDTLVTQGAIQNITWAITETNAGQYYILRNGTVVASSTSYTSGSEINQSVNTTTTGDWNYTIIANDMAGNTAQDEVIVTVSAPPSGKGGGGGGGGGAPPSEDQETKGESVTPTEYNVKIHIKAKFSKIDKDKAGTIEIPEVRDMLLTEMKIKVNKKVYNVKVELKVLMSKPEEIAQEVTGKVLRYLKIDHENIKDGDIDAVTVKFKVEKSWLTKEGADSSKVVLKRYKDGEWKTLPTGKVDEDDDNIYYSAESPGLSHFAVAIEAENTKPVFPPTITKTPKTTESPVSEKTELEVPTELEPEKKGICGPTFILMIAGLTCLIKLYRR